MSARIDEMVLSFRKVLAATERLSANDLRQYQQPLLGKLLEHARQHAPFYRDRLAPVFQGNAVQHARWTEIPILTREAAQRNVTALRATSTPPHLGKSSESETSGSTGRPFRHYKSQLAEVAALGMTDRVFRWWGLDGTRTLASFVSRRKELAPPPDGATFGAWYTGVHAGRHHVLDMWADTDAQIDWLAARKPSYLSAYSTTLIPLAVRSRQRGISLRFDLVLSVATTVTDQIRRTVREAFGCHIADQYGADEVGHIAGECPVCGEYHIASEAVLCEILDERGRQCGPGETGRVIVTSLYNYAMPLIRYEIGDFATVGREASCRSVSLPTLARVVGRYRNTFTLADGRVIYPYVDIARFRDFLSFSQVQVVQTAYDAIEVRYVSGDAPREADEAGLGAYLSDALGAPFRVTAVCVSTIERDAEGKFEDFLSQVARW